MSSVGADDVHAHNVDHWYTCRYLDTAHTFRVIGDIDNMQAADGVAFLDAQLEQLEKHAAHDELLPAATCAYRSVWVQVSLLDGAEEATIPVDTEEDAALDLWSPMHLALVLRHETYLHRCLLFHQQHAVAVISLLLRGTPLRYPDEENTPAFGRDNTVAEEGGDSDPLEEPRRCGSPPPATPSLNTTAASLAEVEEPAPQLVECQVRPELGRSVLLLGYYTSPHGRRSADGRDCLDSSCSSMSASYGGPGGYSRNSNSAAAATAGAAADDELQAVQRSNQRLAEREKELLEDQGDVLCVANVLTALTSPLTCLVHDLRHKRGGSASAKLVSKVMDSVCGWHAEPVRRPSLLVDCDVLYTLSGEGDLAVLTAVLERCRGDLTPVFCGQRPFSAGGGAANPSSLLESPMVTSLNGLSAHMTRASSVATSRSTPRGNSVDRHGPPSAASLPFWLSCAPQEVQRLAFIATWITFREERVERHALLGGTRRTANFVSEYRVALASLKKLRELRYLPPSVVWCGHVLLVAKLMSRECSVEDFIDLVGDGTYTTALAQRGIPGAVVAVMAAGVIAASMLPDPAALRHLSRKVDTLLVEVPGRPSALRAFLVMHLASDADRFESLWLGATTYSPFMKFRSRPELVFFCAVELVLRAAEAHWRTAKVQDGSTQAEEITAALCGWVAIWRNFFTGLRDRPYGRRTHSRSSSTISAVSISPLVVPSATPPPAVNSGGRPDAGAGGTTRIPPPKDNSNPAEDADELVEVMAKLCAALPERLRRGDAPLPQVGAQLHDGGKEAGEGTTTGAEMALPTSSLDNDFELARRAFASEAAREPVDTQLKFYGLFKQATVGDINISKPWLGDQAGRAKWSAWNSLKGMTFVDAKRMYVNEYKIMTQMRQEGNKKK